MTPNDEGGAANEETQSSALIGTVLGGRYKLLKLLGEGGMGAVYLGEQMLGSTARKVAVKTLHPHLSHDPKILARFERECGTVAELQHPNTIAIYDFGKSDEGLLYIVMEYVEGRSVGEILEKDGPMPPARVEKVLSQVTGSLTEAHAHGIIHRDLKPDNILLCERAGESDWVEVLDFGIAKRSSHEEDKEEQKLTQQGMVLGTPPYMSPEQFTGKPIDARSDIYSLGVMAYEMLTGKLPFAGNTAWEWATQHMTQAPIPMDTTPLGAHVPVQMRNAIMKALEKLPENRFSSVREFMDAFGSGKLAAGLVSSSVVTSGRGGTAPIAAPEPAGASGRGKTEMGAPMQAPAGFGSSVATTSPAAPPAPHGAFGTPAAGNHAYAAASDAGEPGRGKGLIFGAIGVLTFLSIGGILVGTGVLHGTKKTADFSGIDTSVVPETNITPPPADPTPTAPAKSGTPLTTLTPTQHGPVSPKVGGKPPAPPTSGAGTTPAPTPPATPPAPPPVTPPAPPPPTPPPPVAPPKPQPAECTQAGRFCNHPSFGTDVNIQKLCEQHKQACIGQGGHFP